MVSDGTDTPVLRCANFYVSWKEVVLWKHKEVSNRVPGGVSGNSLPFSPALA